MDQTDNGGFSTKDRRLARGELALEGKNVEGVVVGTISDLRLGKLYDRVNRYCREYGMSEESRVRALQDEMSERLGYPVTVTMPTPVDGVPGTRIEVVFETNNGVRRMKLRI